MASRETVAPHAGMTVFVVHIQRGVGHIRRFIDLIKCCGKQFHLLCTGDSRQEENDSWMNVQLAITAAKFDCVIGD